MNPLRLSALLLLMSAPLFADDSSPSHRSEVPSAELSDEWRIESARRFQSEPVAPIQIDQASAREMVGDLLMNHLKAPDLVILYEGTQQNLVVERQVLDEESRPRGLDNSTVLRGRTVEYGKKVALDGLTIEEAKSRIESETPFKVLQTEHFISIVDPALYADKTWFMNRTIHDKLSTGTLTISFEEAEELLVRDFGMDPDTFGKIGELAGNPVLQLREGNEEHPFVVRDLVAEMCRVSDNVGPFPGCHQIMPIRKDRKGAPRGWVKVKFRR